MTPGERKRPYFGKVQLDVVAGGPDNRIQTPGAIQGINVISRWPAYAYHPQSSAAY